MYTIRLKQFAPSFRIVLGTREDGFVLVPGDETPSPKLYWIDPSSGELGQRYMTQDQREWWSSVTNNKGENE